MEVSEEIEQLTIQGPTTEERRMSRELQVKLEVLQLHPAQNTEEGEPSQMKKKTTRLASATLRPLSTIPPALRCVSTLVSREVSTKFNQYLVVPMHNSTAEDGKQNHTTGLVLPRDQNSDKTDMEVAEIVTGTASNSSTSGPEDGGMSPDNYFDASDKPIEVENYGPDEPTLPAANTFATMQGEDEWLKRYLPDGHNSQIGNVPDRIGITTQDSEKWHRVEIPYLNHFYNTNTYLVGAWNEYIYALRGEKKEMVCMKIMWTPYNLTNLEEVLRNNQYLRLKGIKTFEEEGENIMDRLVSIEER